MERLAPVGLNNIEQLSILLQFLYLLVVKMRLYEVAEIGDEEDFASCVPQEGVLLDLLEQELVSVPHCPCLMQDEAQKLDVLLIGLLHLLQLTWVQSSTIHQNEMKESRNVSPNKARDVLRAGVILIVPAGVRHLSEQTRNRVYFELEARDLSVGLVV